MKVELKSIKYCEALSQETPAFSGKVYVNGRHVGQAENAGHGGPTDVRVAWKGKRDPETNYPVCEDRDKKVIKDLHKWAKKHRQFGIEELIEGLLYDELYWRDFQKLKRSKLVYLQDGKIWSATKGSLTSEHIKSGRAEEVLKSASWWKDNNVFLNNITRAEFLEKYLTAYKGE